MRFSKATETAYRDLIEAAKKASELAYRPYSKYNVGAAVLTFDGEIYVGCNVENCGYSQTVHAEEVAVCNAIANRALKRALDAGLTQFDFIKAVAVYAPKGNDPWPCCNCRQFLNDFGLKMHIIGYGSEGKGKILCKTLGQLIPDAFPMEEVLASVNGKAKPKPAKRPSKTSKRVATAKPKGKLFKANGRKKAR